MDHFESSKLTWYRNLSWHGPLLNLCPTVSLPSHYPPLIPSGSIDHPWPEESLSFPVWFDFRDYYPPQEWELLLSLYCHYRCSSTGYALSATLRSAWVHFQLEIQANHAIRLQ